MSDQLSGLREKLRILAKLKAENNGSFQSSEVDTLLVEHLRNLNDKEFKEFLFHWHDHNVHVSQAKPFFKKNKDRIHF